MAITMSVYSLSLNFKRRNKMKILWVLIGILTAPLQGENGVVIRTPENYFQSIQYKWSGEFDNQGKKIPSEIEECLVRGLYHPLDKDKNHQDRFSMIDFKVYSGSQFNPIRFKTIQNIAFITSGTGTLKIYNDDGTASEYLVAPQTTLTIPAKTKYSLAATGPDELTGIMVSTPAWFKEDEEYDWGLVREFFPEKN